MTHTKSQETKIREYLMKGNKITFLEAYNLFGVMHLPRRAKTIGEDLMTEKSDYRMDSQWVKVKNRDGELIRVKQYFLVKDIKSKAA